MRDPEQSSLWLVRGALDFPSLGQHDLLHHRKAQSGAGFLGGEIRFKDFGSPFGRHSWPVVPDLQNRFSRIAAECHDLDVAVEGNSLCGVKQQVKQRLAEHLFIRFESKHIAMYVNPKAFFPRNRN